MKQCIKHILPVLLCLFCCYCSKAQGPGIAMAEYYIDTDPGYGNATPILPVTENATSSISFNTTQMRYGVHIVGMRTKDKNGAWGLDNSWMFVKLPAQAAPLPALSTAEYYIDSDPGYGKGTPITLSAGGSGPASFTADITKFGYGPHVVGIRSRDANGAWTLDNEWIFVKQPAQQTGIPLIARSEYYIDADPGYGKGTAITLTPSQQLAGLPFNINLAALKDTIHTVGIRTMDANGKWSLDNKWVFTGGGFVCVADSSITTTSICKTALPYTWNGSTFDSAGSYAVHLTSVGGCDSVATLVLKVFSATFTSTMPQKVCWGGFATTVVKTANGVAPYQFSLNGGPAVTLPSYHIVNLTAGVYSYTVTDATGCSIKTDTLAITQPANRLVATAQSTALNCAGNSATITVDATGGYSTKYLYNLNGGDYKDVNLFNVDAAGTYTLTAKDPFGCISSPVAVTITQFTASYKAVSSLQVCYNGFAYVIGLAKGGTEPYLFSLGGGPFLKTADYRLTAGVYSLAVKDSAGCIVNTDAITVTQPEEKLTVGIQQANATCTGASNGSITAVAAGSYGNYLYSLNNGSYQPSGMFTGLSAGIDSIKVKDENGCLLAKAVTITQPAVPCNGENILLKVVPPTTMKVVAYPNPSTTGFELTIEGGDEKNTVELLVRDMFGKTIYHATGTVFDKYRFGSSFAGGLYIVQVLNGNKIQTVKVVKGN